MTRRIALMAVTAVLGVVLLYLSRFWWLQLWPREGLLGIEALRPQGDLVARWTRGTPLAPFELILWVLGAFLALTWTQWLIDRLWPLKEDDHD